MDIADTQPVICDRQEKTTEVKLLISRGNRAVCVQLAPLPEGLHNLLQGKGQSLQIPSVL